jgi:hypothetical protein
MLDWTPYIPFPAFSQAQASRSSIESKEQKCIQLPARCSCWCTKSPYTILAPNRGQPASQPAWPRRGPFPTIGSAGRTVQLGRFPVILQKNLSNFSEINPQSRASPIKSFIKPLKLYRIQPAVQVALPPHSGLLFTRNGPSWAEFGPTPFSYFPLNLFFT